MAKTLKDNLYHHLLSYFRTAIWHMTIHCGQTTHLYLCLSCNCPHHFECASKSMKRSRSFMCHLFFFVLPKLCHVSPLHYVRLYLQKNKRLLCWFLCVLQCCLSVIHRRDLNIDTNPRSRVVVRVSFFGCLFICRFQWAPTMQMGSPAGVRSGCCDQKPSHMMNNDELAR